MSTGGVVAHLSNQHDGVVVAFNACDLRERGGGESLRLTSLVARTMTLEAAHHERRRATWPQRVARSLSSFLEVLRVVVAPSHDDQILDPAANE